MMPFQNWTCLVFESKLYNKDIQKNVKSYLARAQRSYRPYWPSTKSKSVILTQPFHNLDHVPLRPNLNWFYLFWSLSLDAIGVQTSL
jgi:hypothetical protein